MYTRVSAASELRQFSHFHILKQLFFQYFVGTSYILSVQITCLSAYNVPTKLQKRNVEGPAPLPPPPPGYDSDDNSLFDVENVVLGIAVLPHDN